MIASAQPTPLATVMAATGQFMAHAPHCYEFCQVRRRGSVRFPCFLLSLFSFSSDPGFQNVFLATQQPEPLLILLSVHDPAGAAHLDTYGHSLKTNAPNLQSGPLPAPVRLRARAV